MADSDPTQHKNEVHRHERNACWRPFCRGRQNGRRLGAAQKTPPPRRVRAFPLIRRTYRRGLVFRAPQGCGPCAVEGARRLIPMLANRPDWRQPCQAGARRGAATRTRAEATAASATGRTSTTGAGTSGTARRSRARAARETRSWRGCAWRTRRTGPSRPSGRPTRRGGCRRRSRR